MCSSRQLETWNLLKLEYGVRRGQEVGSYFLYAPQHVMFGILIPQMPSGESSENPTMIKAEHIRQSTTSEVHKKESLSDEELGNLLAAFGNSEAKAITLIAMEEGVIYDDDGLMHAINRKQGKGLLGWRIRERTVFSYCSYSFEDIGLVAKAVSDTIRGTWGYIKTDYGKDYGDVLAGLLLDFSLKHPKISLYEIFGPTTAPGGKSKKIEASTGTADFTNRSPLRRLQIIWELATNNKPLKDTRLGEVTGIPVSTLADHLGALKDSGLVHFDHATNEAFARYQLAESAPMEPPRPEYGQPTATKFLYELLRDNPNKAWSLGDLNNAYVAKRKIEDPEFGQKSIRGVAHNIVGNLSYLEDKGYIYRSGFRSEEQSSAWVDEGQRLVLIELLTLIYQFQMRDAEVWQKGRDFTAGFKPEEINRLMAKAREHSRGANALPRSLTSQHLLEFLENNPESTAEKATEYIEVHQKRKFSRASVALVLRDLLNENKTQFKMVNGIKKWSLGSNTPTNK